MSDRTPDTRNTPPEPAQNSEINPSRRKLTGAALGVSAIFTLASSPVLAGACVSPSAAASGNLSHHGTPPTCTGKSPGYWKKEDRTWPSPYVPGTCSSGDNCTRPENWTGGTLFHDKFMQPTNGADSFLADFDGNSSTPKTSLSMKQVLAMNDGGNPWGLTDKGNLGAHVVAALLNDASGRTTSVLPEMLVMQMWNEWATEGFFSPTAGVQWSAEQIVSYITTTFSR